MPFLKKALYYGLMFLLTLLMVEGSARLAYYLAFDQSYAGGRTANSYDIPPPPL